MEFRLFSSGVNNGALTTASQANHHRAESPEPSERRGLTLVPIQTEGSCTPIYFVHEILGGVDCYAPLASALGPDQPIYAFKPPSPKHGLDIRQLAALYLRDLLFFQPKGPYIIGGYSFGGIAAFEMATQLRRRGDEASLVIMFDCWIWGSLSKLKLSERGSTFLRNARHSGASYIIRKAKDKSAYWWRIGSRDLLNFAGQLWEWFGADCPNLIRVAQAESVNGRALAAYRPVPYDGRVLLIMSRDRARLLRKRGDPTLGWANFTGPRLEIRTVATDHTSFLNEENVPVVVAILKRSLAQRE